MNKTKPSPQKKWIWIAHPTKTFTTAYIISEDTTTLTVETQENKILTINKELTYKMNPPKFDNIDDLASLSYLNEPSVLHNLATRYYNDIIYTYSGLFLVAINPYKKLKIYSSDTIREYHINKPQDLPPHIYATASQALRNMLYNRENQSILITGESGAGKTENTKKVIQFLTTIAPVIEKGQSEGIEGVDIRDINNTRDTIDTNDTIDNTINTIDTRDTRDNINYLQSSFQHTIEHQIFMAHPILESFGNAQTIKNNNSSRFGKFIKILFSNSTITGAYIEKYLLEKSRVTHQNPNERNYHIFYQLLCGADQSLKDKLLLEGDHTNYTYTRGSSERDSSESKRDSRRDNSSSESKRDSRSSESKRDSDSRSSESKRDSRRDNSSNRRDNSSNTRDNNTHNNTHNNTPHINNINDSNDFITLNKCFDVLKITEEERLNYFTVISAILHLGNIEVLQHNDQAYINNTETVEKVCNLLKIETKKFLSTLLHPISMAGTEKVINMRNKNQVINIIEALSRTLYERLFDTVIDRLNYTLNSKLDSNKFIGVLDIAGFEIFKNNSFEQLCINYTNEKLQQFFNHHMFVLEQELYKQENIKWDYIDFGLDLQPTIDVIDKSSPIGVMSYLDEECVIPKGSDKTFLEKVISGIKCSGGDSSRMGDSSSRGDRDSNYRGVNNLSDKQQGVNTSSKKQQGVNTSSKKQQGVNNLSDTLHPVNNNHIEQHPLNTIKHPSFNQYGNIFGPLRLKNGFFIKHYAGKVEYLVDGWIEKNKDTYFDSLSTLLLTSTNLFIKDLFDCYISSTKKGFFRTVSQRHKEEIYSLMTQLTNTSPHFVRCILPNIYKKNYNFDLSVVLQQLRCNGVIEGIRISRLGYPGRMTFIEFKKRYSVLIRKRSKIVNSDKVEGDMDLVEGDMDIVEGDSNSRGIVEGDSNIKGDSDTSNKQQGVNNSTNKQQGVNNSTNKQQGVNHTTNNLHTLTNKQHPLTNTTTNNTTNHLTLKDSVFLILSTLNIPTNSYRIGITKVFFKQGVLGDLEDIRDNIIISLSKEIISLYLKVLIIRKNNKKKKNEKNIKILQKNLKILLNIKRWKWFKLYIKIKPLFVVTHYELESKKLKDIIYNLNIENNNYKSYNDKLNCNICKIEKELESSNKLVEEWKDKLLYLRGEYESRIVLLESREKEYEDRIVLLENREKEYESRIGEYENSNRLLESRIEDHTNTIKEKDTLIQEKDTLIQEKDILIQDLNNNIEDHIKIIKDKDNNIKDKDTIIKDRDTMINTLNTNIQDYTTSVNNLQLLLNDKTSELNTIKEKHNLTLKELKDKEMGNRIVEYESKIVGLESRIVEYENKIVGLENSNKEYEDKNKVLEDKNKVLEDSNKVLEDKIEELSNTNISLSNTNTTLSNKNKELENKNKELENTNLSLENTNTSLSNTNISLSTQVTDLSNTNLSLSNTNISLST
ncbi:heavy chain of myosin, partial [Hamiltosporidium tvaerminnensis]